MYMMTYRIRNLLAQYRNWQLAMSDEPWGYYISLEKGRVKVHLSMVGELYFTSEEDAIEALFAMTMAVINHRMLLRGLKEGSW